MEAQTPATHIPGADKADAVQKGLYGVLSPCRRQTTWHMLQPSLFQADTVVSTAVVEQSAGRHMSEPSNLGYCHNPACEIQEDEHHDNFIDCCCWHSMLIF